MTQEIKKFKDLQRRGVMLVLSSPSGAGKTTISREILSKDPYISLSVSVTTRPKRDNEEDGVHYHFKTEEEFQQLVQDGAFLEHATVFGYQYGTLKEPVYQALENGNDILFDIDWQGTQQIREAAGQDVVRVFILPPSQEELESRLRNRAQDNEETIAVRMAEANNEISHYTEYQYIVVNNNLNSSVDKVYSILKSERMKRRRLTGLNAFIRELMGN